MPSVRRQTRLAMLNKLFRFLERGKKKISLSSRSFFAPGFFSFLHSLVRRRRSRRIETKPGLSSITLALFLAFRPLGRCKRVSIVPSVRRFAVLLKQNSKKPCSPTSVKATKR